jgi:hypothetical protein
MGTATERSNVHTPWRKKERDGWALLRLDEAIPLLMPAFALRILLMTGFWRGEEEKSFACN